MKRYVYVDVYMYMYMCIRGKPACTCFRALGNVFFSDKECIDHKRKTIGSRICSKTRKKNEKREPNVHDRRHKQFVAQIIILQRIWVYGRGGKEVWGV